MEKKIGTIKLTLKAFKEVVSAKPEAGIIYFISRNIVSLGYVYEILIMGKLLDSIGSFITQNTKFEWDKLLQSDVTKNFIILIALALGTTILSNLASYLSAKLNEYYWYKFNQKTIEKIATLNLEDIENSKLQNLLITVPSYGTGATWDIFVKVTDLIYNIIKLVSAGYIILNQMSAWGLLVIVLVIPEAYIRFRHNVKLKKFRDENAEKSKYADYLYNQSKVLNNFPELRVDNIFDFFIKSFERTSKPYIKGQNKIRKSREIWTIILSWFDGSLRRFVQVLLIPVAVVQRYSIGTFKYLFDYIDNLYNSSWYVIWNILMIKNNTMYVRDYFNLVDHKGFGDIECGNQELDPISIPKIEFVNVDFKYPNSSSAALDSVSFTIEPGEKVAIIGGDNSGKSTIAKLTCGLYKVGPGDILIDDISIKNLKRGQLKDKISVIFENYVKYNFSIRKNITVAEPERDFNRRRYEEALEITGLKQWMDEEKIKDSQVLGKLFGGGMDVSTGHWQRIAIARALYRDRAILILDESLTQIDGYSRRPIIQRILTHRPKQTFINITQEETEKDLFDKIIYIEKGRVKEVKVKNKPDPNLDPTKEIQVEPAIDDEEKIEI